METAVMFLFVGGCIGYGLPFPLSTKKAAYSRNRILYESCDLERDLLWQKNRPFHRAAESVRFVLSRASF